MSARGRRIVSLVALALSSIACDKPLPPPPPDPAPSAAGSARREAGPPDASTEAPRIVVSGRGCTIDDKDFPGPPESWRESVEELLRTKRHIDGEAVVVKVVRGVRMPRVLAMLAALQAAKAKSVVIQGQTRYGSDEEVRVALGDPGGSPCVAVAIAQDLNTKVSGAGGPAETVPRGDLGLDPPRVSLALRRRLVRCESRPWTMTAADTVPWLVLLEMLVDLRELDGGAGAAPPFILPFPPTDAGARRHK